MIIDDGLELVVELELFLRVGTYTLMMPVGCARQKSFHSIFAWLYHSEHRVLRSKADALPVGLISSCRMAMSTCESSESVVGDNGLGVLLISQR